MESNTIHYVVLGVFRGDSEKTIKAAFRKRAKELHPDHNANVDTHDFVKLNEAYEYFEKQNFFSDEADAPIRTSRDMVAFVNIANDVDGPDYEQIVRDHMSKHHLKFSFEGVVVPTNANLIVQSYDDIPHVLAQQTYDAGVLCDEIMLDRRKRGETVSVLMLRAAVRTIARDASIKRQDEIMLPLLKPLNCVDKHLAELQWKRFCAACFDMHTDLAIAILKKFVHQVKSKLLSREVKHHIAVALESEIQGSGKTTCARSFLRPLYELSSGETTIGNFVDARNVDLYRYLAVFLDDLDELDPKYVGAFKSLVTGDEVVRRRLQTSRSFKFKQRASLMVTCNRSVSDLIPDPSGNRRLAPLLFRNGDVARGGCSSVWQTISETDFVLLWRSVDVFGSDPIAAHWKTLRAWQDQFRTLDPLEAWLQGLDVSSGSLREISTKRGPRARPLYALFEEETGSNMSETAFGRRMAELIAKGHGPFGARIKCEAGNVYPLRTGFS